MEPHEALAACVAFAAGQVSFYRRQLAGLGLEEIVGHPETRKIREGGGEGGDGGPVVERTLHQVAPHIWLRLHDQAMSDLARYAKLAADAGIDERREQRQEREAVVKAEAVRAVVLQLGLCLEDPAVERAVRAALTEGDVEGRAAEART